jgi:hypothetical protein
VKSTREQSLNGRNLHSRHCDIPQGNGQQANPDPQSFRPCQCRGRCSQPALEETVFPQPQLLESGAIRRDSDVPQSFWWKLREEHGAEHSHRPTFTRVTDARK